MAKYLVLFVTVLAITTGCTSGERPTPTAGGLVTVTASGSTTHTRDIGPGTTPAPTLRFLSDLYEVDSPKALHSPATVVIRLAHPVPERDAVVVATREDSSTAWTYLPANVTGDRTTVTFTTTHFSIFGVLAYDLADVVETFKRDFLDAVDGGATQTVDQPTCDEEQAARNDGYTVKSSTADTVYWCFGEDATGKRILKVTDHRRYPLLVEHPDMQVIKDGYDWGQLVSLSRLGSGADAIIAPGGTAVFDADLTAGGSEGIQTRFDGLGQSLYALQAGVTALVQILGRFGAGSDISAVNTMNKVLTVQSCADSLGKTSGDVIAGCFDAKTMLDVFGVKGLLLAPIMTAGPVIAFFHSEWNALVDQFNGHSAYHIAITRAAPVLNVAPFVGDWFQHAGDLNIHSDGTISLTYQTTATINGLLSAAFPQLELHIVSTSDNTAMAIVDTSDDPATPVGTKLALLLTAPGITITPLAGGTSTWCDPPHKNAGDCGV